MPEYDHRAGGRRRRAGQYELRFQYGVPVSSKAPVFSDISFRNIEIKGAKVGVEVCGLPESPVKVRLDKVEMQVEREIQVKDGEVLDF